MRATFVETKEFTKMLTKFLPDHEFAKLQKLLMKDSSAGTVMPGCGPLRKIRIPDAKRGKGKRGGARVIYLHVPEANRFYMLDIYGKDEKDDLSAYEKKELRILAEELKTEAAVTHRRRAKEDK
ncbi:MAG TPA: type II toxin-antitoxin system RelE/ParE family toxin [Gemmataceae bacterium]|jgi:mRNA-degrading endonuclease RelE of RelBE toxin-antitoxin system|nr:type II toxin-antitoxin system RelE/ParE family toxin [Gemmataceae bacterium]